MSAIFAPQMLSLKKDQRFLMIIVLFSLATVNITFKTWFIQFTLMNVSWTSFSFLVFFICFWLRYTTAVCKSICLPDLPRKVGYPKYISGTKIPASKVLVCILFALNCFKLSLQVLNYLGWLNEILFVFPYKKI